MGRGSMPGGEVQGAPDGSDHMEVVEAESVSKVISVEVT